RAPRVGMPIELAEVAGPELVPLVRIVAEPLPECGAGGNVLQPGGQLQAILREAARPQPFHEEALAVDRRRLVVDPFESDHGLIPCSAFVPYILRATGSRRSVPGGYAASGNFPGRRCLAAGWQCLHACGERLTCVASGLLEDRNGLVPFGAANDISWRAGAKRCAM